MNNLKIVILAGGLGSRLSEETDLKPKPMVEIGGFPIIWHIMKIYSSYGFNDFIICLGYKGYVIKEYFINYLNHKADISIDYHNNDIKYFNSSTEPWKITLFDTGNDTMTGGRLKRILHLIDNDIFFMTYGDGLADINIKNLLDHHLDSKKLATVTAVQPPGRFGALSIDNKSNVSSFLEKPIGDTFINGGYFVLNKKVGEFINDDSTIWENEPLEKLSKIGQLSAFKHNGFWQPMDTLREKNELNNMWNQNKAPWKKWD